MKKFIIILIVLIIAVAITAIVTHAEEPPYDTHGEENASEQTDLSSESENASDAPQNGENGTSFSINELTAIFGGVSVGSVVLSFVISVIPWIRAKGREMQSGATASYYKAQADEMRERLADQDFNGFKDTLTSTVSESVGKLSEDLLSLRASYVENKQVIETIQAQISALISAATNAWAQSPAAVHVLTESPTASALAKVSAENEAMKTYIRQTKGEEADDIIRAVTEGKV